MSDLSTRPTLAARWAGLTTALGPSGWLPLVILTGLASVTQFDLTAFGILSPDIRHTFHISTGAIDTIATLTGAVPVIFSVYLGYLGDKMNRLSLSAASGVLWGITAIFTGLAPTVVILILARLVGGVGLLTTETVYPSLLSDYHAPEGLGTVFGAYRFFGQGLGLAGGPLAGVFAAVFGWRVAFVILAIPTFVFVVLLRLLKEPERGASLGFSLGTSSMSLMEGYRRVRSIRTARRTWMAAFMFGAGTVPFLTLLNTFFKDVYHFGDTARGTLSVLYGLVGLVGVFAGGSVAQRLVRSGRFSDMPVANAAFIIEFAFGVALMAGIHNRYGSIVGVCVLSLGAIGFLPIYTTLVSIIAPPALRAQAYAWTLFFYALGAITIQALVISPIINAHGQRVALLVLSGLVATGGFIGGTVRRFVDSDIAQARRQEEAARSDALLSCRGVDAAYGGVQVLFGVDFEVDRGEMVALLGTNGAGKSTFLKTITGLLEPTGGVVSFKGRDISHLDPMATARLGVMQVPGGRGIFPTLSVAENIRVAGWMYRKDRSYLAKGTEEVLAMFPVLRERWDTMAGDMSGGEQQMLSLAQAFLAEPELLLIDELSLGLAPTVVSRLVDVLRRIHDKGTTIILVEQSVNTALELAERAIFMEKGQVRFSGPTTELLERPDILRAVFLQGAAVGHEVATSSNGAAANGHGGASGANGHGGANGRGGADGQSAPAAAPRRAARTAKQDRAEVDEVAARLLAGPVVLETREVTKRYGGVVAVDGVSFELHKSEILGFIGPNGAGKTTLFDLISGFTPINGGRIILNGTDVTDLPAHRRAGAGLGRSFQDARLWPALTVAEALAVALHGEGEMEATLPALLGAPRLAQSELMIHDKVDELIDLMGLEAFRNKFISELSTGSRRIVELGCMVAHHPSVLILDEPSSGIAQRETEALGPLLRRIRSQIDCSVLIIEHDIPLINGLADHMVALDLGRVVAYGRPDVVLSDPHVVESYLGSSPVLGSRSAGKVTV